MRILCAHGVDPDRKDATDSTVLHIAARYRHQTIRDMLCSRGADQEAKDLLCLKPGSYRFSRNIHAFDSVVGNNITSFAQGFMQCPPLPRDEDPMGTLTNTEGRFHRYYSNLPRYYRPSQQHRDGRFHVPVRGWIND